MNIRIVVADENSANFFDVAQPDSPLQAAGGVTNPTAGLSDRDLESDRPGRRAGPAAGFSHGTNGERSTRRHATELFAREVAQQLNAGRTRNEFDRLVLVAGPRMLGLLRDALPTPCLSIVAAEVVKDLAHQGSSEIRDAIPEKAFLH